MTNFAPYYEEEFHLPIRAIEIDNRPKTYTPTLAAALKDLGVPNPATAAIFVNQLSFWLNTKAGQVTKDGEKFIYNTYEQWRQQFPCMSESQIGRMIRSLCNLGIIAKESFSSLKRRLINKPNGFQEYNQTSWMTLCASKLVELGARLGYSPESLLATNLQYCSLENLSTQNASCETEFSTIYRKNSISPILQEQEKEIPSTPPNASNSSIQQIHNEPEVPSQNSHEHEINHESNMPATSSKYPKKRTSKNTENNSQEFDRTEKYVWEIAVGEPYEVFLQWWADTHYKPQGGKWETGAYYYAGISFYNNSRATLILWKQFSEYIDTVSKACNQLQNDGQQAALPSCFVSKPEATEENKQALMGNIAKLVKRGAAVVMPTKSATPTSQTLPFTEAQGAAVIKSLPALEEIDLDAELRKQRSLYNQPEEEIKLLNEWLVGSDSRLREEAQKLAVRKKYGFERGESGDICQIFSPKALSERLHADSISNIDWSSITAECQELEKDAWGID